MASQPKLDFDVSVSTRLPASDVQAIDEWADRNFSDRSKVLNAILRRVLAMMREVGATEQAPGDVVRRLRLIPA